MLVLEPGTGLEGKIKTARKGVGDYTVTVKGRASHAGVDFQNGASAIVELARQIERIAGFTQLDRGITVNPGVISGGTRTNVIAAEARAEVDIRVARLKDALGPLDKKFHGLGPFDKRCAIHVEGGLNRPPMERSRRYSKAVRIGARLGQGAGTYRLGRVLDRRRIRRQFHRGARDSYARWPGRRGRGRACCKRVAILIEVGSRTVRRCWLCCWRGHEQASENHAGQFFLFGWERRF